ncbi:magnesium and cobalt transport protein CorA [Ilumatobacter nonamiensis]|uniref:magnesium and cobalt transport protein CorA n=1 Tax=Ilumatobacter nonamiensis TaxID=467093 RepID=UPI0003466148|nr:magnesium and cobalt transport protein CorA [Ilumatobacter nonamiensis]
MLVNARRYADGSFEEGDLDRLVRKAHQDGGFVWAGVHDPGSAELNELFTVFGPHPLAVEDAVTARQRPKFERYDDWSLLVLHTAHYVDDPETVEFGEIQVLCDHVSAVVIRRGAPTPLVAARRRLEARPEAVADGPVSVVHGVIDEVVDSYDAVLAGLDDDVSEVELAVFAEDDRGRDADLVERMYFLQREMLRLHRAFQPLGTAIAALRADPLVKGRPDWDAYFRDVVDHLLRQIDQLHTLRDLIASALAANATQVGLRQNDDMRKISAWVAIAAVPTMIAGIYGMNFDNMPELDNRFAYPIVLVVMVTACLGLYRAFRRSGWL